MKTSRRQTNAFKTKVCCYCAECDQKALKRGEKQCNKKDIRHGACVNYREMKKGGRKRNG
ncbi:hypothetical protein ES703_84735 [subsurface metagenome]